MHRIWTEVHRRCIEVYRQNEPEFIRFFFGSPLLSLDPVSLNSESALEVLGVSGSLGAPVGVSSCLEPLDSSDFTLWMLKNY